MTTNCRSHPGNVTTILCETCEKFICEDCYGHDEHDKIQVESIEQAYRNSHFNNHTINKLKKMQHDVQARTDLVVDEVKKAGEGIFAKVVAAREIEIEIAQSIVKIKQGSDSIQEQYLKIIKAMKKSKNTSSSHLEFIQSHYLETFIPKIIGRLDYVASDQELVELCSFRVLNKIFIKSICIVDPSKAWILHYKDTAIHLVDYNGQILETRELGEVTEDFCITTTGDVLYTVWNGLELKKMVKDKDPISLHEFDRGYFTRGLCSKGDDVMVCLCSTRDSKPNRLAKMSCEERSARQLQFQAKTDFSEPGKVSCKNGSPSVIAVVDWNEAGRIVKAIDNDGKSLWEWNGQLHDGSKLSPFLPFDISFCNINERKRFLITLQGSKWNKICSIDLQGKDAKCIYTGHKDSCNGAIAIDPKNHIWIGDQNGIVHIMAAIYVD
ncbi:uncharacterized protein LOC117329809 [Pecten maximus]|uniref:uncharacterized protein LOC117329809 n=1 Tax=Pecten maximus TaxID=6579 RepID=UPI001458C413|nr:uncharacterized protein LOC117329809 [Pecten maximus]